MKWDFVAAVVLGIVWIPSTSFFVLEAWGERGVEKSWLFQLWASFTWIGPFIVMALLVAAIVRRLRHVEAGPDPR
ncbi:MAG: hypothetical protein K1X88_28720 [Nannocystaceae bacterium]|nr:hypothetical protein [Nannocystaceae bacterium]